MFATTEEIDRVLKVWGFDIPKGAKITGIRLGLEYPPTIPPSVDVAADIDWEWDDDLFTDS